MTNAVEELTDEERVIFSVMGAIRFDAAAVAEALRSRSLTPFEAHGLANLLEGKHPHGLQLKMHGQGKGWKPVSEGAAAYDRLLAIGSFVDAQLEKGATVEEAVIDAAAAFNVSEPTVYRDLRLYRLRNDSQA